MRALRSSTSATISSAEAPSLAALAAASTIVPRPPVIDLLSINRMSAFRSRAPVSADCRVAESPAERLMHTMESAPSSSRLRNVASNAPGAGAAVCGRSSLAAIRE